MKQKFSNPKELHEFFLSELQKNIGVDGHVITEDKILHYYIYPDGGEKCLWQCELQNLFEFITKYELSYYIDFQFGYFRVYTDERLQISIGNL